MKEFNVLFTSAGRRVALIRHFKKTLSELGLCGKIVVTDAQKTAPASFIADHALVVPRVNHPDYIAVLLQTCKDYNIRLVVPLIDTELSLLAKFKQQFEHAGITVLVSSETVNEICFDKRNTNRFFASIGVNAPHTYAPQELADSSAIKFPLFLKPATGSCSIGATKIHNIKELDFFEDYISNPIIQDCVVGEEYTVDVLVDFAGKVRSVVPRLRVETRAGEVSKGITVKNRDIIAQTKIVVEALPGAVGCITVQCFLTADNEIKFIEINPRFGGGHPLSLEAGADFPRWIIQMLLGVNLDIDLDTWEDGVAMLRYDDAIFVKREDLV